MHRREKHINNFLDWLVKKGFIKESKSIPPKPRFYLVPKERMRLLCKLFDRVTAGGGTLALYELWDYIHSEMPEIPKDDTVWRIHFTSAITAQVEEVIGEYLPTPR